MRDTEGSYSGIGVSITQNTEGGILVVEDVYKRQGSQMSRQGEVALQADIISEALSNAELPHRVMSYCTFWDYTILHRFREYDDPRSANENIFNYVTSVSYTHLIYDHEGRDLQMRRRQI